MTAEDGQTGGWKRRGLAATAAAVLAAGLAGTGASSAAAYFDGPAYAFPVPNYVDGLISASILSNTYGSTGSGSSSKGTSKSKPKKPAKPKPKPKRATAQQLAALRFVRDPAATAAMDQGVVERAAPADPALLMTELTAARAQVRDNMRTGGSNLNADDLGDLATWTILVTHVVWHSDTAGTGTVPDRATAQMRTVVRHALALDSEVRGLDNAAKQNLAEGIELRTITYLSNRTQAIAAGDTARVIEVREDLRDYVRDGFGIDVAKLRLTSKGASMTK